MTHFDEATLGGIRTVLRYEVPTPNRRDTAFLLLSEPVPGGLPVEVEIRDASGQAVRLIDSEGADCTLADVSLYRAGGDIAVIAAKRTVEPGATLAEPGAMTIQTYRLRAVEIGRAAIAFTALETPIRTAPLCDRADVDSAIEAVARKMR